MKKTILLIMIILLFSCLKGKAIEIEKIDFFGFKVNYTYEQIIKELKKQKKNYEESKIENIELLKIIELKDQYSEDDKKMDFIINTYRNKLMVFKKYNLPKDYLKELIKKIGDNYKTENINEFINFSWDLNDYIFRYQTQKKKVDGWDILSIGNKKLLKEFEEYENSIYEIGGFLAPNVEKLRLRESPSLNGKFIRSLEKGELLTIVEIGKEDVINGKKGKWIKVKTNKDEIGWCFSGYLNKTL